MSDDPAIALFFTRPYAVPIALVWGALWGSFFNVAIHRLAAAAVADESETWLQAARASLASLKTLVRPASHCPRCKAPVRAWDNIPILSWLILRGRCRNCRAPISIRYPLVEAAGAGLAVAVYFRFVDGRGAPPSLALARFLVYFFFAGALFVLAVIDLETMFLPLAITLPALPAFFVAGRVLGDVPLGDALVGLALGFGLFFLLRVGFRAIAKREGLGGGDEMLVGMVGGLLGWRALPFTLFLGAALGTLTVLPILLWRRRRGGRVMGVEVPFGPFLALGALVYLFFGDPLWRWLTAYLLGEG